MDINIENLQNLNITPGYITNFVCTYNRLDDHEDSLILYQIQMLQAFDLLEFDEKIINKKTEELYEKFKDNKYIKDLIKSNSNYLYVDDNLAIFRLHFSYGSLYLFHSILCSLINNKEINNEDFQNLLKISIF